MNIHTIVSYAMYWKDFEIIDGVVHLFRDDVEVGYCLESDLTLVQDGIARINVIYDDWYDACIARDAHAQQ